MEEVWPAGTHRCMHALMCSTASAGDLDSTTLDYASLDSASLDSTSLDVASFRFASTLDSDPDSVVRTIILLRVSTLPLPCACPESMYVPFVLCAA